MIYGVNQSLLDTLDCCIELRFTRGQLNTRQRTHMSKFIGKSSRLFIAIVATATTALLSGCIVEPPPHRHHVGTVVTVAPPPLRVEVRGEPPYPGYIWFDGYWSWQRSEHVWVPGHWAAPRPGYRWVPHHWVHERDGWFMEEGHWERGRR